ncbi:hypothetical protein [Nocardia carnea]|nr:hypothetical protein [Nocardia carnea]
MVTALVVLAILILVASVVHLASRPPEDLVSRRTRARVGSESYSD